MTLLHIHGISNTVIWLIWYRTRIQSCDSHRKKIKMLLFIILHMQTHPDQKHLSVSSDKYILIWLRMSSSDWEWCQIQSKSAALWLLSIFFNYLVKGFHYSERFFSFDILFCCDAWHMLTASFVFQELLKVWKLFVHKCKKVSAVSLHFGTNLWGGNVRNCWGRQKDIVNEMRKRSIIEHLLVVCIAYFKIFVGILSQDRS